MCNAVLFVNLCFIAAQHDDDDDDASWDQTEPWKQPNTFFVLSLQNVYHVTEAVQTGEGTSCLVYYDVKIHHFSH